MGVPRFCGHLPAGSDATTSYVRAAISALT